MLEKTLKKYNKSYTKERRNIYNAILTLHHFSFPDLEKKLSGSGVGRTSVFRTLKLFLEIGLIKIIGNKEGTFVYEIDSDDEHHEHMKCIGCEKIIEFDDSILHNSLDLLAGKNNFKVVSHSVILNGFCNDCID